MVGVVTYCSGDSQWYVCEFIVKVALSGGYVELL